MEIKGIDVSAWQGDIDCLGILAMNTSVFR